MLRESYSVPKPDSKKVQEQLRKPLRDLIDIIQFTENVGARIHGLLDRAEIYKTVKEEFARSKRHDVAIYRLTDDGSQLQIVEVSLPLRTLKAAERVTGSTKEKFRINLDKSTFFSQVVKEGKTVQANAIDVIGELFPRPLAYLILKITGYEKYSSMITPLQKQGKIIGVLAVNSIDLPEYYAPSVSSLAQHISAALGLADGYVERKKLEKELIERAQVEEELRKSEEKYRSLVELAPDSIMTFDLKGVITSCNTASTRLSGYSEDELVGRHFTKLVALRTRDIPKYLKMFSSTLRGKIPDAFELTWLDKDGNPHNGEVRFSFVREKGKIKGIQAIMRDVTERKRMEDELAHERDLFRALMDSIPDPIYFKDTESHFMRVSRTSCPGLGVRSPEEAVGMTDFDFCPEELAKQFRADDYMVMKSGKPLINKEEVMIDKTGKKWYSATKVPIRGKDGRVIGLVGISRNITKLKETEEKLKRYSEHLEELVEERTKKLKQAERMAAIGETTAMVGHDLRNPLQSIVGLAYLASGKLNSVPDEVTERRAIKEYLEEINEQVLYMDKIVSDLRDYARPVNLKLEETDLVRLIEEVLSTISVPENIQISIRIGKSLSKLPVDPESMKRVFTNLILNAVQAMPGRGKLTMKATQSGGDALISVEDNGVGIPEENLNKIFQPLFTTKSKGQGFGLPVCKRLVEAHGGTISVTSKTGKGSTFTVSVPLQTKMRVSSTPAIEL